MAKKEEHPKDDAEEEKKPAEGENGEEGSLETSFADAKKKARKKKIIIAGAALAALLLGGGGGLYFSGALNGHAPSNPEASTPAHGEEGEKTPKTDHQEATKPAFFQLGDLLVNLSGDSKRPSFLKVNITLELANEKDTAEMNIKKPRIIDNFQVYLRELRVEDLRGSAGLYRLREELLMRINEVAAPIRVRDVLFQEMLIQ